MRWLPIFQTVLAGLLLTGRSHGQPASIPADDVERLPAFKVAEPRAADFLLHWGPVERNPGSAMGEARYLGPTRMWLTQWPRPKTPANVRLPPNTSMWVNAAYRGRGLKDGDEIIRLSGRLLTDMKPGECVHLFFDQIRDPEKLSVEVEVRANGEKGMRKVIVTKAPFNEVIVTKKPVELLAPVIPLPEPTVPASEPRDKK